MEGIDDDIERVQNDNSKHNADHLRMIVNASAHQNPINSYKRYIRRCGHAAKNRGHFQRVEHKVIPDYLEGSRGYSPMVHTAVWVR